MWWMYEEDTYSPVPAAVLLGVLLAAPFLLGMGLGFFIWGDALSTTPA